VGTCSLYLLLCWFVNAISWLRLGNVYRAYLVSKRTGGSVFWAIGTVVSERFLDLAAVLLMLAVAGALLLSTSESRHVWPFLATALAVTGGLVLVLIVLRRGESRLTRLVPPRLRDAYERFIASALASVWNRDLPVLLLLTLAGWGLEMARLWLVVLALHLHISPEMLLFVTFAQGLLISAPLTPGGLGVVEPGLTGVLLFAFARDQALSIALLDRSISYVSIVLIGTLAFGLYEVAGRLGNSSRRVLARRPTI
jgi:uncharacterized protein (TIRG00374 family)